jgi:hypothetical protein
MSQLADNLKKNPSIPLGVVVLVVCGVIGFFRANHLTELSDLETELNAKLDKINSNVKQSENIEQDTQKLEEFVEIIDERLFVADERSMNIDFFYSFEDKLDIVISEVDQLEEKNARFSEDGPSKLKNYSVINYNVTVSGSFREIVRLLYEIQQVDHIMRVSDFQINTTNDRDDNTDRLSAEIKVAVLATK